jgi:hypothetical protein
MTLPDPSLDRSGTEPENRQDTIPATERNQDPGRAGVMHEVETGGSRPLTRDEKEAAEHDEPLPERVYAPASERVPREPVPGHRDFVEHTDPSTPERQAAGPTQPEEPSFTRVARPSATTESTDSGPTSSTYYNYQDQQTSTSRKGLFLGMGIGWLVLSVSAAAGAWFYIRWRREQNKPMNRIRRQARQAASEIRDRVPTTADEAVQPAVGVLAALLSTALVIWRQSRARSSSPSSKFRKQAETISDADWQQRLIALKERWSPRRLELEKVSISRH